MAAKNHEWHFNKKCYEDELAKLRLERKKLLDEEKRAKEEAADQILKASQDVERILEDASILEKQRIEESSALRERLAEMKEARDEFFEETDEAVQMIDERVKVSRAKREEFTTKLSQEKKIIEAFRRRLRNVEIQVTEKLAEINSELELQRNLGRKELVALQAEIDAEVFSEEEKLSHELKLVSQSFQEASLTGLSSMNDKVTMRRNVWSSVENTVKEVDRAVDEGLLETRHSVLDLGASCSEKMKEIQTRDICYEKCIVEEGLSALTSLHASRTFRNEADVSERLASRRREGAAEAFGKVFPRSTQFQFYGQPTASGVQSPLASSAWLVVGAVAE